MIQLLLTLVISLIICITSRLTFVLMVDPFFDCHDVIRQELDFGLKSEFYSAT